MLLQRPGQLEIAVRRAAAGMHDALGNALMVEVGDLLAQDEVFQQRRPARGIAQRVLVVGDRNALVGGQRRVGAAGVLMQFVPLATAVGGRCGFGAGLAGGHVAAPGWREGNPHTGVHGVNRGCEKTGTHPPALHMRRPGAGWRTAGRVSLARISRHLSAACA